MGTVLIDERMAQLPGSAARSRRPRWRRLIFAVGGLMALAALAVGAQQRFSESSFPAWASSFASTDTGRESAPLVHVAPQVAGQVLRVHVSDDQPVLAGDLLVEIDPEEFVAAVLHANAQAEEAVGRLEQARWQLALAESARTVAAAAFSVTQDRARHTADGHAAELGLAVAQAALDSADARINLARAQIQTARAGVVAAQIAAARARIRLAHTEIHAPQTGRVRTRSVEPGDYVQVGQELLVVRSDDLDSPAADGRRGESNEDGELREVRIESAE